MTAAIELEGVTRAFGAVKAVDSLSLRVGRGTIFGFLGVNGAGKTTVLLILDFSSFRTEGKGQKTVV